MTNVLSVSKSGGIIGSLRLVVILTKYELNNSFSSGSFCSSLSTVLKLLILGSLLLPFPFAPSSLKVSRLFFESSSPASVFD